MNIVTEVCDCSHVEKDGRGASSMFDASGVIGLADDRGPSTFGVGFRMSLQTLQRRGLP